MKKVSLSQYRTVEGKWQFVPVARAEKGEPKPAQVVVKETISSSALGMIEGGLCVFEVG